MCCIFDLLLPIGWNELGVIASVLGTLVTVIAVIVALNANKKASDQIKSALDIQEQSKNIELLDKRVEIIEGIEKDDQISLRMVKLLFSEEIVEEYAKWLTYKSRESEAQQDIRFYFSLCKEREETVITVNRVEDEIRKYEYRVSQPNCPEHIEKEFEQFCNDHAEDGSETGELSDTKHYNYYELNRIAGENRALADNVKKSLLNHMEQYIAKGIESLSETRKGGKTK